MTNIYKEQFPSTSGTIYVIKILKKSESAKIVDLIYDVASQLL